MGTDNYILLQKNKKKRRRRHIKEMKCSITVWAGTNKRYRSPSKKDEGGREFGRIESWFRGCGVGRIEERKIKGGVHQV